MSQLVADILNSLIRKDILYRTGASEWDLNLANSVNFNLLRSGGGGRSGSAGQNAPSFHQGIGAPMNVLGVQGDFYIELPQGDLWRKQSPYFPMPALWKKVASLKGSKGPKGEDGKGERGSRGLRGVAGADGVGVIGAVLTGGTVGSVLFVGAGGTLAQDNANFFWNDTTNVLLVNGTISSPGAGSSSEHFGASSTADGTNSVAVGKSAASTGNFSVAIGEISSTTQQAVAVGRGAAASGSASVAVGYLSSATSTNSVAIGNNTVAGADRAFALGDSSNSSFQAAIAIGGSALTTAANQLVIGADFYYISEAFLGGNGVTNATPQVCNLNATGGSGTNVAGADLSLVGGKATGNAAGGEILFKTSDVGSSGTTLQSATTKAYVNRHGLPSFGGTKRLTSNATNATTTMSNLTDLSVTLIAGRKYTFKLILFASNGLAADGIKIDFDGGTATMTSFRAHGTLFDTALLLSTQTSALATDMAQATVTGDAMFEIHGALVCNAAGTFIPRFAKNADAAGATLTAYLNSFMIVEETAN